MKNNDIEGSFVTPTFTDTRPITLEPEIECARYFCGANLYAPVSALCIRIAWAEAEFSIDHLESLSNRFRAAGIEISNIQVLNAPISAVEIDPLKLFAAALTEILAFGVIKNVRQSQIITILPGENSLVITWPDEDEARDAVDLVKEVICHSSEGPVKALRAFLRRLAKKADEPSLGVTLKAAQDRGIPWSFNKGIGYHQLGHGCHRTRIQATITGKLSAIGVHIVRRKSIANTILRRAALPVPLSVPTQNIEEALEAKTEIGFPVVVKPMIGHKGKGVTVGVSNAEDLLIAFRKARNFSRTVIVEQLIEGEDIRLLVVGRKLVAAAKRIPPQVTGDGISPISRLIHRENGRRSLRPNLALPIDIDSDVIHTLKQQGHSLNTVLPASMVARLRTVANWSQGGTTVDLTDSVHPDNADMAVRAALATGIDVAGVDYITTDVSRPYYEVGGAICEINYRPGLRVHQAADPDGRIDIGSAIIESMISGSGRIDIVFVVDAGGQAISQGLAKEFADSGKRARVTCAYTVPETWQKSVVAALDDPDCDALIINAPAFAIVNQGAGVEYCCLVARFNGSGLMQDQAQAVLTQICNPENVLALGTAENSLLAIQNIARFLGLTKQNMLPVVTPVEITTSRDLMEIARNRGLTCKQLAYWNDRPLLQFGYGASLATYRGRRTGATSYIATRIADDKRRTNEVLRAHDLPHAKQIVVHSVPAAIQAARQLHFPVIVKPVGSSESRGITGDILNDEELEAAVSRAFNYSDNVILEPFLKGNDHRFLIVGGKVAHITRHEIAQVTGDGWSTVEQLVSKANENPLRGDAIEQPYTLLRLQDDALRMLDRQGFSVSSVPEKGKAIMLSSICHLSTGGTAVDVTGVAHPDNIAAAERIARLIGLDICGIDFLHPDVTKSYREVGGVILEVNQGPSFDMHDASTNSANKVRSLILQEVMKNRERQIPVLTCILSDETWAEDIALAVTQSMRSQLGLTVGSAVPALGLALIGTAIIRSVKLQPEEICNAILSDRRVDVGLFISGSARPEAIPQSAETLDFSKQRRSREDIINVIIQKLSSRAPVTVPLATIS